MLNIAWYRNSYVTAYWEIEDVAMDVYEMALTPIVLAAGVLAVYAVVVATGVGFVVVGYLLLRRLVPPFGNPGIHAYASYPLTGILELSSVGAAIFALPTIFAWHYLPMKLEWGLCGLLLNVLLKIILSALYGTLSGAAGSGLLLLSMPRNTDVLPVLLAMVAGALGGLVASPPVNLVAASLVYWQKRHCTAPVNMSTPLRGNIV